jgi:hypothetical protein
LIFGYIESPAEPLKVSRARAVSLNGECETCESLTMFVATTREGSTIKTGLPTSVVLSRYNAIVAIPKSRLYIFDPKDQA